MNLPAILKKRDLLETFRESVSPRHEPSHSHRQPSVEDEVENEEEEEAASYQGSQHSEELPEVADILGKAAPRQK